MFSFYVVLVSVLVKKQTHYFEDISAKKEQNKKMVTGMRPSNQLVIAGHRPD